jgi:hypothetical protein
MYVEVKKTFICAGMKYCTDVHILTIWWILANPQSTDIFSSLILLVALYGYETYFLTPRMFHNKMLRGILEPNEQ